MYKKLLIVLLLLLNGLAALVVYGLYDAKSENVVFRTRWIGDVYLGCDPSYLTRHAVGHLKYNMGDKYYYSQRFLDEIVDVEYEFVDNKLYGVKITKHSKNGNLIDDFSTKIFDYASITFMNKPRSKVRNGELEKYMALRDTFGREVANEVMVLKGDMEIIFEWMDREAHAELTFMGSGGEYWVVYEVSLLL